MRVVDDGRVLELADRLLPLLRRGAPLAVATCIDVVGSAPHGAGSSMVLPQGGPPIGSVSGGCVEAAALADCRAVLAGTPAVVRRHGFGDAQAASSGLACGGEVDVLTHRVASDEAEALAVQLQRRLEGRPAAVAVVAGGPDGCTGLLATADDAGAAARAAGVPEGRIRAAIAGAAATGRSGPAVLECAGAPLRLFVEVAAPAPRLLVVGATEVAVALSAAAAVLGRVVTVCDPRAEFAAAGRFPAARAVLTGRPHEVLAAFAPTAADAVCLLSHDEDLDALALAAALESPAGYVGALGSRSTAARRLQRLRALDVPESALRRLRGPIGLDVGARTPAEIAVSIVAELLAVASEASAAPLTEGAGAIHRSALPA